MGHSTQRTWVVLFVTGISALLVARLAADIWRNRDVAAGDRAASRGALWVEVATGAIVLAIGGAAALHLVRRDRFARERSRLEHLAQVGVLSGGLAHEIRNYTNAMQAYLGLLRKSVVCDPQKSLRHIEKLEETAVGLEEFLNEFLAFARPVRDQLEEVDPGEVVAQVVDFAAMDLEQAGVEVVLEIQPALPRVYVDKAKLKRAVLNLVVNSRQAMPAGGKLVLRVGRSGARVWIEVEDTGCGIPREEQGRVFETFFSTKPEGTGLGLAIVKRTIEDLGGTVAFRSEPGQGTTFRIVLPVAERYRETLRRLAASDLAATSEGRGRP
jgi:signal transduction histidine kinase